MTMKNKDKEKKKIKEPRNYWKGDNERKDEEKRS